MRFNFAELVRMVIEEIGISEVNMETENDVENFIVIQIIGGIIVKVMMSCFSSMEPVRGM
ncbi:MAG: hypothetical protein QXR35_04355 [Candidatus Korarchaeum sp.]